MLRRQLQKMALYSLAAEASDGTDVSSPMKGAALQGLEKEFDIVVLTRKVGESVLVPARGLTIKVGSIHHDRVSLRITVPSATTVFRLGVPIAPAVSAPTEQSRTSSPGSSHGGTETQKTTQGQPG